MTKVRDLACPCGKPVTAVRREVLRAAPQIGDDGQLWETWEPGPRIQFLHGEDGLDIELRRVLAFEESKIHIDFDVLDPQACVFKKEDLGL
jgi:hypothetical protein